MKQLHALVLDQLATIWPERIQKHIDHVKEKVINYVSNKCDYFQCFQVEPKFIDVNNPIQDAPAVNLWIDLDEDNDTEDDDDLTTDDEEDDNDFAAAAASDNDYDSDEY